MAKIVGGRDGLHRVDLKPEHRLTVHIVGCEPLTQRFKVVAPKRSFIMETACGDRRPEQFLVLDARFQLAAAKTSERWRDIAEPALGSPPVGSVASAPDKFLKFGSKRRCRHCLRIKFVHLIQQGPGKSADCSLRLGRARDDGDQIFPRDRLRKGLGGEAVDDAIRPACVRCRDVIDGLRQQVVAFALFQRAARQYPRVRTKTLIPQGFVGEVGAFANRPQPHQLEEKLANFLVLIRLSPALTDHVLKRSAGEPLNLADGHLKPTPVPTAISGHIRAYQSNPG